MKVNRKVQFTVELNRPENATLADCREYILDAVRSMKGCLRPPQGHGRDDPGDPMYELDRKSVRVRQSKKVARETDDGGRLIRDGVFYRVPGRPKRHPRPDTSIRRKARVPRAKAAASTVTSAPTSPGGEG